jgi:hypothetical protein
MSKVLLGFVGDVLVHREDPPEVFREVREILKVPDILFANLESACTDDPQPLSGAPSVVSAPAHNLDVYAPVGFKVMSLANNAIMEAGGLRVAFLAYACMFPIGHEARSNAPGLAPMRAYNYYREPFQAYHQPGTCPIVTTVPDLSDLEYLTEDIHRARARADIVITSFHWGDQTTFFHLTDHETRTARHCIDEGAHMVVGHHHHALRGMEWYKGKPILYGLNHFVFDLRWDWSEEGVKRFRESEIARYYKRMGYQAGPREGWPLLPFPEEARLTVLAWATADTDGISDIGFLPCRLSADGLVHPLRRGSPAGDEVVRYLQKCNETQNLKGSIVSAGALRIGEFDTLRVIPN